MLRLAVLGRPNAGKSSILNALLGEERLIVSDIAGTTRDAVDVAVIRGEKRYQFVDTAGVRKRTRITDGVEQYSVGKALSSANGPTWPSWSSTPSAASACRTSG